MHSLLKSCSLSFKGSFCLHTILMSIKYTKTLDHAGWCCFITTVCSRSRESTADLSKNLCDMTNISAENTPSPLRRAAETSQGPRSRRFICFIVHLILREGMGSLSGIDHPLQPLTDAPPSTSTFLCLCSLPATSACRQTTRYFSRAETSPPRLHSCWMTLWLARIEL